jgi:hypothetical protein
MSEITLMQKLEGVREIAEGEVVPEGLLELALEKMTEGHWQNCTETWEEVDHVTHAREELGDFINYLAGMVLTGELTRGQARIVAWRCGDVWAMLAAYLGANERGEELDLGMP